MLNAYSHEKEAIELTKRSIVIADVAKSLQGNRFATALVLRMHDTASIGRSIANLANVDNKRTDEIRLAPGKVAEAIASATRSKAYALVVAAFELHHLAPEEEFRAAQAIGDALSPGGAFLAVDYTLPNADPATIAPYIRGTSERANVETYGGLERWLPAHAGWSVDRLTRLARNAERSFGHAEALPAHAGVAIASDDLDALDAVRSALAAHAVTQRS